MKLRAWKLRTPFQARLLRPCLQIVDAEAVGFGFISQ